MAQSMKNNGKLSIQISGYTDEIGIEEYNFHLGQMRAQAVKEFLIAQGVNPQMLSTISYGEKRPAMQGSNSNDLDSCFKGNSLFYKVRKVSSNIICFSTCGIEVSSRY